MKTSKRYYKNINQELSTATVKSGRKRTFNVNFTNIINGFAIDNGKDVDFYNNLMEFICTKRFSGKYFDGIFGKEITKKTFKAWDKKCDKIKAQIIIKNLKTRSLNAVKMIVLDFNHQVKINKETKQAEEVAKEKRDIITSMVKELSNSKDKTEWQQKANQIVGTIGYEFVKIVGWKNVLTIAKNLK